MKSTFVTGVSSLKIFFVSYHINGLYATVTQTIGPQCFWKQRPSGAYLWMAKRPVATFRESEEIGGLGTCSQRIFRAMPSSTSKNVPLENERISLLLLIFAEN